MIGDIHCTLQISRVNLLATDSCFGKLELLISWKPDPNHLSVSSSMSSPLTLPSSKFTFKLEFQWILGFHSCIDLICAKSGKISWVVPASQNYSSVSTEFYSVLRSWMICNVWIWSSCTFLSHFIWYPLQSEFKIDQIASWKQSFATANGQLTWQSTNVQLARQCLHNESLNVYRH